MRSVQSVDGDQRLRVGGQFRVEQPRLPSVTWQVTELRENDGFVWENRSPGVLTKAFHGVTALPDGTTRIALTIDQTGPLAGLMGLLLGRITRRYMAMEAAGMCAAAESAA